MRLLSRYVILEFLRFFCIGLVGCVALFMLVELFDRIDEFVARRVFWADAGRYLVFRLPGVAYQLTPVAFLLASVLTFSRLNRGNEVTAMRAGGMAPLRLARPLFWLGGIGAIGLLLAQEYIVPYTNQFSRLLWRTRIQRQKMEARLGMFKRGHIWYRRANRIWSIQLSQPLEPRLLGVTIYILDADGKMQQRYDAAEAQQDARGWILRRGMVREFASDGTFAAAAFAQRRLDFPERVADMIAMQKQPEEMRNREILAYARQLRRRGLPAARFLTEFYGRSAYAAACIIMAVFGMPLALRLNRSGGTVRAIGVTVCSGFGYWVVYSMSMALGTSGQFPPLVAAWSPNLCFGLGSAYLAYRLQ